MGAREVACLGYEGTGVFNFLAGIQSHVDGNDPDYDGLNREQIVHMLIHASRFLRVLEKFASHLERVGVHVTNGEPRGLITMFPPSDALTQVEKEWP